MSPCSPWEASTLETETRETGKEHEETDGGRRAASQRAQRHRPKDTWDRRASGERTSLPSPAPPQNTLGGTLHLMPCKPVLRHAGPLLPRVGTTYITARSRAVVLAPASASLREALIQPQALPPQGPLFPQNGHGPVYQTMLSQCSSMQPILEHSEKLPAQHLANRQEHF